MNRVELRSFLRNFIPFFIILELLVGVILYKGYQEEISKLEHSIAANMDICNFHPDDDKYACLFYVVDFLYQKGEAFSTEFLERNNEETLTLYKKNNVLYKYYSIPNTPDYHLRVSYPATSYQNNLKIFQENKIHEFLLATLGVLFITALFSLYSLAPLRDAFKLTQEFTKDILHDFNTPISALMLNVKTLPKTKESYEKINRIEQSINTILSLQENLKSYLKQHPKQVEKFDLFKLVEERVEPLQALYPHLTFTINGSPTTLHSNQASVTRILDNLLINAAKYNRENGHIDVQVQGHKLTITDTGKGIKHANKIFDRFYKEHERGLGIGLHIVKKLCDELGIKIKVRSEMGKGTTFVLRFL